MKALAPYLKQLRTSEGLTQAEAAERAGVHVRTVERWEGGKNEPKATELQAYVRALRGSVQRAVNLLLGLPDPTPPTLSERHLRALAEMDEEELNLLIELAERMRQPRR